MSAVADVDQIGADHDPIRARRRLPPSPPPRWRRVRRVVVFAALLAAIAPMRSYVGAMLGPSNSSWGIRSVEWLRDHGAAGLVSRVEDVYYSLTAPSKGGPQLRSLPSVGFAVAAAHHRHARPVDRPATVRPVLQPALPGEGVWRATRPGEGAGAPVQITTYRPLPDYPRIVVGLAWVDTHRTSLRLFPGRQEPSVSVPQRGPMEVPLALRGRLLATFNSGFKLTDAHGGFALNGHAYAPMVNGDATIVGDTGGRVDVEAWHGGPGVPADVAFARQNLPLIVDGGRPNPDLADGPRWGATVGNAILVWRSGIGLTHQRDLVYAAGNDLSVADLARILIHAGAVRAMELDINSYWTSFITYGGPGALDPSDLTPYMVRSATRYLSPDDRDFFAVLSRSSATARATLG